MDVFGRYFTFGQIGPSAIAMLLSLAAGEAVFAQNSEAELKKFQGAWEVEELAVNGEVISADQVRYRLPSGGKVEIIENAIIYRPPGEEKQRAKTMSVDAAQFPKTIDVKDSQGNVSRGIYQFAQGKLIICAADRETTSRPREFSAPAGSQLMLITLRKRAAGNTPATPDQSTNTPPPSPKSKPALQGLSDADVARMLLGTWVLNDSAGALFLTFRNDSTFNTVREQEQLALFHRSIVRTPISSGKWNVKDGRLTTFVDQSVEIAKVNHSFAFSIRSISEKDLITVDWLGRTVRAMRVK